MSHNDEDCDTLHRTYHRVGLYGHDIECTDSSWQFMTAAQPRPEYHVLEGSPLKPTVSTFHLYTLDIESVRLHDHLALAFHGEPSICIQASRPKDDEHTRIEDLFFYYKQLVKPWSEIP